MTLSRALLRQQVVALLQQAQTPAGDRVYSSRDIPVPDAKLPVFLVYGLRERGEGRNKGTNPQFGATLTLAIEARSEHRDPRKLEAELDLMAEQALNALLTNAGFVSQVDWFPSFEVQFEYKSDGKTHIGSAYIALEAAYGYLFEPVVSQDLGGVNLTVDSGNIFDPTGTYAPQFGYPVPASPRATGPDGRAEIAASIDLPST